MFFFCFFFNVFKFVFFQLDKSVITAIATGDSSARNKSLIKIWCKTETNMVRNQQELHHMHK